MLGNLQVRFGGGRMEKGCNRLSSDLETGISHSLASRLPDCNKSGHINTHNRPYPVPMPVRQAIAAIEGHAF